MNQRPRRTISPLAEAELETLEEGRDWMRRRLEAKLQRLADRHGALSPPQPAAADPADGAAAADHDRGGSGAD